MLSFCVDAGKHYEKAAGLAGALSVNYSKPDAVVVAGMGGSGIGGELLKDWARGRIAVPVEVCKDYSLPAFVGKRTLVFVVSYSGETEETLSVFLEALKRKCMIVSFSSGGKLQEFSERMSVPYLKVPSGMAPRAGLPYLFLPLIAALEKLGLVSNSAREVSESVDVLKQISRENSPAVPMGSNFSKKLAMDVNGTVPVVYGFGCYRTVAQRFKTQFNENSKNPAKWEFFPELEGKQFEKWFSPTFIRDVDEPPEMRQRIEATKELMKRQMNRQFEVHSRGKTCLAKMASVTCIGDFTSVYLAILRGIDPTPVKTIASLKQKVEQTGLKAKVVRELEDLASK
jgi:glucose/mannose-6-phosphate isomerase